MTIRLTLPFPVSANRYWRYERNRIHRSAEADAYKQQVGILCSLAGIERQRGNVCLSLDFYRPAKRGDLDNLLKVTIDALNGYAYVDDKQIVEIHAMRHDDKSDPRIEILIQAVQP